MEYTRTRIELMEYMELCANYKFPAGVINFPGTYKIFKIFKGLQNGIYKRV